MIARPKSTKRKKVSEKSDTNLTISVTDYRKKNYTDSSDVDLNGNSYLEKKRK